MSLYILHPGGTDNLFCFEARNSEFGLRQGPKRLRMSNLSTPQVVAGTKYICAFPALPPQYRHTHSNLKL